MLNEITQELLNHDDIAFDQMEKVLGTILNGECDPVAIGAFLTALASKGETAQEIAGLAAAMRAKAVPVIPKCNDAIDIVGTGGDGAKTFNISTTTAFVVAGCGVKVAKHGNRAITSQCGSADILAQLGVKIDASPEVIADCIDQANIGFMFAPCHHPAMKYVQPIRKALGFRTVFNILGPLSNPAHVSSQFTGVANLDLVTTMSEALKILGTKRAMVVFGNGMDEISISDESHYALLENGQVTHHTFDPGDCEISPAGIDQLVGGSLEDNEKLTRGIISGEVDGPCLDVVLVNAAGALIVAEKVKDFSSGIDMARESIQSGSALKALTSIVKISNQ